MSLIFEAPAGWLERIDPGSHRRVKGLRLVTAYGLAAMWGALLPAGKVSGGNMLSALAGGFALWASVSEGQSDRGKSARDLLLLCGAAGIGALSVLWLSPLLSGAGRPGLELTLASGAFLVGYLKRFGIIGAGIGSQIYIGQLLAFGGRMPADAGTVVLASGIAALSAIVPRFLSGPAEHPVPFQALPPAGPHRPATSLAMGIQAATAALAIVLLTHVVALEESVWAITACTYVIASSAAGTMDRVRRRIIGTIIGVPLGLIVLSFAAQRPTLLWTAAALAMIIYAIALPDRYDISCGAFAFTLMVTLAASGIHTTALLTARIWETIIGCVLGLAASRLVFPLSARLSSVQ